MAYVENIFWISFILLFYCYIGYGFLLAVMNRLQSIFKRPVIVQSPRPGEITMIVAAYNESAILEKKIKNCLDLNYPAGKLKFIFITDGSTDDTPQIVAKYPGIQLLHNFERKGKLAAIKRAMQIIDTPLVVFSDANSMLNKDAILKITLHYNNPSIGGVAGEKRILPQPGSGVSQAEGLYWQYESFLKKQDSGFYTVVGAAGELFSIRTSLFKNPDDSIILDDFLISMQVCLQHHKIAYEPGAYAIEAASSSLAEEEKRKVRISAGAYQSVGYLTECLNIFSYPLLAVQYFSRRLLRWIICPVLLPILFLANFYIVNATQSHAVYNWLFNFQMAFYLLAMAGWALIKSGKKAGILSVPFYFVFMNYCLVKGFYRFLRGKQSVLWEKSLRGAVN